MRSPSDPYRRSGAPILSSPRLAARTKDMTDGQEEPVDLQVSGRVVLGGTELDAGQDLVSVLLFTDDLRDD